MPIEDVFTITGRGTVVAGRVEQGQIDRRRGRDRRHPSGDREDRHGRGDVPEDARLGSGGDNAGALLRGVKREEVERGQVLAEAGVDYAAHGLRRRDLRAFEGRGRRHTPFFSKYRPQFYFRTTDDGRDLAPGGPGEMVMPGDNTQMSVELIQPIAMDEGAQLRRPRGRSHGRRRRRHEDHEQRRKSGIVAQQKIRIRLKGYDHQQLDRSASQIVETAQRTGATITGLVPCPPRRTSTA